MDILTAIASEIYSVANMFSTTGANVMTGRQTSAELAQTQIDNLNAMSYDYNKYIVPAVVVGLCFVVVFMTARKKT